MTEENYKFNVPDEIYGEAIDGIDLTILGSDSARLIEAYVKQEGDLSAVQWRVLKQCDRELQIIIPKTDGKIQKYFRGLYVGINDVFQKNEEAEQ